MVCEFSASFRVLANLHYRRVSQSAHPPALSRHASCSWRNCRQASECRPRCIRAQRPGTGWPSCRFCTATLATMRNMRRLESIVELGNFYLLFVTNCASCRRAAPTSSSSSYQSCLSHRPVPTKIAIIKDSFDVYLELSTIPYQLESEMFSAPFPQHPENKTQTVS